MPRAKNIEGTKSSATDLPFGNLSSFVGLATHRDGPDGAHVPQRTIGQCLFFADMQGAKSIPNETGANMNKSLLTGVNERCGRSQRSPRYCYRSSITRGLRREGV